MLQENPSIRATSDEFKGRRGSLDKFYKRNDPQSVIRHAEAFSPDKVTVDTYKKNSSNS